MLNSWNYLPLSPPPSPTSTFLPLTFDYIAVIHVVSHSLSMSVCLLLTRLCCLYYIISFTTFFFILLFNFALSPCIWLCMVCNSSHPIYILYVYSLIRLLLYSFRSRQKMMQPACSLFGGRWPGLYQTRTPKWKVKCAQSKMHWVWATWASWTIPKSLCSSVCSVFENFDFENVSYSDFVSLAILQ